MKKLILANFKAFGKDGVEFGGVTPDGNPMNILCYGENGAGKSSVFEAIKYIFHRERIERERIEPHLTGQARENARQQILIDYKNKKSPNAVTISINNQPYADFSTSDYHVYMITSENLEERKQIDVKKLLKSMYLGKHDIEQEVTEVFLDTILEEANKVLKECFFEDVKLEKSLNGAFLLKIVDEKQGLEYDVDLGMHFNEAKLHLINLLLALTSIMLLAPVEPTQKKILVLDDFITSLDTANRSFLYQYITTRFSTYQILIFTHNTSFYNLCDHFISEDNNQKDKWLRQGVFEYNNGHEVYNINKSDTIKKLEQRLKFHPGDLHNIGNEVRQYFEVLLHRLALLLMAGAKEETTAVLAEISKKTERRMFKVNGNKVSYMYDLFDSLMNVVANSPEDRQLEIIKKKLNEYAGIQDTDKLSDNLKAMVIYQKVALHQSSHGHEGLPDLSSKEIKASLTVMKKIEATIDKLKIERI